MATACVASFGKDFRNVALCPQRTPEKLKIHSDDVTCCSKGEENNAGICTKYNRRCDSAANRYGPSTPTPRVCNRFLASSFLAYATLPPAVILEHNCACQSFPIVSATSSRSRLESLTCRSTPV